MKTFCITLILLAGIGCLAPGIAQAGEVTIAAASDLNFVFKEVVADFEKKTGNTVKLSLGSSGNFFAQLSNGAPFDLFFSADIGYPRKLEEAGLAEPGTLYMYAVGRIVVWVPKGSPIDVGVLGIKALQHPSVKKIAIANPKHAPYGRAAVAAMEHFKVYEAVKDKLDTIQSAESLTQFGKGKQRDPDKHHKNCQRVAKGLAKERRELVAVKFPNAPPAAGLGAIDHAVGANHQIVQVADQSLIA